MADEGSSLFLCPHCGAFVSESSSTCPNCGNPLEENDDEELELELDELELEAQQEVPETEIDSADPSKPSEESEGSLPLPPEAEEKAVTLFLCSVCGAFTGGEAENCSQCGASMADDEDEPVPDPLDGPEAEVFDMLIEEEPVDSLLDSPEAEETVPGESVEDESLMEDLKNIESPEDVMNFIDSITDDEPEIELDLEPPTEILPERSQESDDLLSMFVYASEDSEHDEPDDEDQRSSAIGAVEDMLVFEESSKKTDDSIAMCNSCGAFVSESADVCNICGNSLKEGKKFVPEAEPQSVEELEDEQADSIIRSLLGVDKDAVFEEEGDRFQADGNLGLCTVCGAFISEFAEACTVCGTHLDEMPEFVPSVDIKDKLTDNKALALCPHCGVFVQEGATECMSCVKPIADGAKVEVADLEDKEFDADKASNLLRNFLGVEKSLEMEPTKDPSMSGLDICPDCGAFVSLKAVSCSVCGNSLFDGTASDEAALLAEQKISCPNCGSRVSDDSSECPLCGMAFTSGDELDLELEGPGEDITDFLELELEESIRHLEKEAGIELLSDGLQEEELPEPEPEETPPKDDLWTDAGLEVLEIEDDISDMLVEEEPDIDELITIDEELEAPPKIETAQLSNAEKLARLEKAFEDGKISQANYIINKAKFYGLIGEEIKVIEQADASLADQVEEIDELSSMELDEEAVEEVVIEEVQPEPEVEPIFKGTTEPEESVVDEDYKEPLEFIDEDFEAEDDEELPEEMYPSDLPEAADEPEEGYVERYAVKKIPAERDLSRFDADSRPRAKPANWATGIYVSVAAICFFLGFYAIVPGDYAPGLAVIFGTLLLIGIYLAFTERGTFFKGDLKRGAVFFSGEIIAATILLHWPMGFLNSEQGALGQPGFDRLMLSISILLISVGILWIRARVRYVFTWFGGILLLFLGTLMQYTYPGWGDAATSPVVLVAGLGASLVFMSLIFLQYERAINTSIESDIVRGDAHYLRHDYKGALASYDNALSKSQIKRVEILGSPLIEYDVPWYSKGSALILMGEFEEGIKCLDMALAINPNNEVTWVNKGNAHSKLGEHGVALECYERAIEVNPFYEIAWNNLGNVMARRKEYVEALKHYNRAIKINPKYDDAWINKGYVLAKMGKKDQAVKCLSRIGSRAKVELPGTESDALPASEA